MKTKPEVESTHQANHAIPATKRFNFVLIVNEKHRFLNDLFENSEKPSFLP
jgi:hypothetical protein